MVRKSRDNGSFAVGDWMVDPDLDQITRNSVSTRLRPQVMELLVYLAKRGGQVVSNEQLLDELWSGRVVTDSTVYNCVAELRHALADGEDSRDYIVTVPKKGYRLTASVEGVARTAAPDNANSRSYLWPTLIGVGVLGALLIAGSAYFNSWTSSRTTAVNAQSVRLPLHLPDFADFSKLYTWNSLALSSDGRQIAYIGYDGTDVYLYLKTADARQARKVPGTAGAAVPFFSPDGRSLAFFADGKLMRIPTSRGIPFEIGAAAGPPVSATWADDGTIYFVVGYQSALFSIPGGGGHAEPLIELSAGELTHREPHALPGGNALLYQIGSGGSVMQSQSPQIWALDLRTGERRFVIEGGSPKYSDGKLLFLKVENTGRSIWSIGFDVDGLHVLGDPIPLVSDPIETVDVSRSGALIYSQTRKVRQYRLRIVGQSGIEEILVSKEPLSHPRFSRDGNLLAISIGSKNLANIWTLALSRENSPKQITTHTGIFPVWSPQDKLVAYYKWTDGIFAQSTDSTAEPVRLIPGKGFMLPMHWSEKGFLYLRPDPSRIGAFTYRTADGKEHAIDSEFVVPVEATISPDGRWLAYAAIDTGRPFVYLKKLMNGTRVWPVSRVAGRNPKWPTVGNRLYFASFDKIMSVDVSEPNVGSFGKPKIEHAYSGSTDLTLDLFDVSPDGKRFAIVDMDFAEPPGLTYVSNVHRMSAELD